MRRYPLFIIAFVIAGFLVAQSAPLSNISFHCQTQSSIVHHILVENLQPEMHRENSVYEVDYKADFGDTISFTVLHARIERHTDGKHWIYETGKEGDPRASGKVFDTFLKKPLYVSADNGKPVNPESIPFFNQTDRDTSLKTVSFALTLSLRHKNPQKEIFDESYLPVTPLGELRLKISYRESGRMSEGVRWEITLNEANFLVDQAFKEVINVELKDANLSGWVLYDSSGFLVTAKLSYRLKMVTSQPFLSPNVKIESSVVSYVSIERR